MNLDAPEEWEMLPKTDYTYAKSMSYNKSYGEGYKTPNMSRPSFRSRHHDQSSDSASSSTSHYNLRSRRHYEPLNFSHSEQDVDEHTSTSQLVTKSTTGTNTTNFSKINKVEEKTTLSKVFILITTIFYSIISKFKHIFHYLTTYNQTNKNAAFNRVSNKINDRTNIIDTRIHDRMATVNTNISKRMYVGDTGVSKIIYVDDSNTSNRMEIDNTAYRNEKSKVIKNTNSAYNTRTTSSSFRGGYNDINDSVEIGAGDGFPTKSTITHHFIQRNVMGCSDDESESITTSRKSWMSSFIYVITWLPMKVFYSVTYLTESQTRQRRRNRCSWLLWPLLLFLLLLPLLYYNHALLSTQLSTTSSSIAQQIPSKQQVTATLKYLTTSAKNLLQDYLLFPLASVFKVIWSQIIDLILVAVTWGQKSPSSVADTANRDDNKPISDYKHDRVESDAGIDSGKACDCSLQEDLMNSAIAKALLPFDGLIYKISELKKEVSELSELINVKEAECVQRYEKLKSESEAAIAEVKLQQQGKPSLSDVHEKFISQETLPQLLQEHRSNEKQQLEVWLTSKLKDYQGKPIREEGSGEDKENALVERTAIVVKEHLSRWKLSMEEKIESVHKEAVHVPASINTQDFYTKKEVDELVESRIQRYDADRTGMFDFALETSGGELISTRCSKTFREGKSQLSIFGIPLFYAYNSPRTIIQPGNLPGECWAFQGGIGFAVVKLSAKVFIDKISIEHVQKNMTRFGNIDSAPKDFSVWGLSHEEDVDGVMLGKFTYDRDSNQSLQTFHIEPELQKKSYEFVELRIYNNHGHPHYTCVYRFRVHGTPDKKAPSSPTSSSSSSRWWW